MSSATPAVDLQPELEAAPIELAAGRPDLVELVGHERLATEAWFNRHDEQHVEGIEVVDVILEASFRLQRETGAGPCRPDVATATPDVACGLGMDGDAARACFGVSGGPTGLDLRSSGDSRSASRSP